MTTLATLVVKITSDISGLTKGLKDTEGVVQGWTSRISSNIQAIGSTALSVGTTAGMAIAGGLALAVPAVIGLAKDFESQMAILSTAAKGAGTGLDTLRQAALVIGSDIRLIGVSAADSADAMTGLYKAGLNTSEIFGDLNGYLAGTAELSGALRASIDLAASSELNLAQASDLVAIAMKTFGLGANDAQGIVNSFVQSADASLVSVSQLGEALATIGPTAAQFGWSLQETNQALAILSTRGITGSEAGTSLKSMMTNLLQPTKDVRETLSDLGVSLYDASGTMKKLPDILGQLEKSLAGVTDEQRNAYIQTLAGTYGMKAMATLLSEGAVGWDTMGRMIQNASTAQQVMATRTATFNEQWSNLKGMLETLAIDIGSKILPALTAITMWASDMISKYSPAISDVVGKVVDLIQAIVTIGLDSAQARDAMLALFGPQITEAIMSIIEAINQLIAAIRPYVEQAITWISQNVELEDMLIAIGIAIAAVVVPALLALVATASELIATAALLIGAVAAIRHAWENDFLGIRTFVESILNQISIWWAEHGNQVVRTVQVAWAAIQAWITSTLTTISTLISFTLDSIRTWWAEHGDAVATIVNFLWSSIYALISNTITIISSIIQVALDTICSFWDAHGTTIMTIAQNTWTLIQTVIQNAITIISAIIEAFAALIKGDWQELSNQLKIIWDTLWNTISAILTTQRENLVAIVRHLVETIKNIFLNTNWGQIGCSIIEGIKNGIHAMASLIAQAAESVARGALEAAKRALGISSPSKLFEWIGEMSIAGWARGLSDVHPVEKALSSVVKASISPVKIESLSSSGNFARETNIYLTANYPYQSEASLIQDVRMLAMVYG